MSKDWAAELKRIRKDHGVTFVELSRRMGVSQSYLVRLERGEIHPTAEQIEVLEFFIKGRRND